MPTLLCKLAIKTVDELLKILAVSGRGIEKIPATSAQIRLVVDARGKIATEVQQETARKSSAVVNLLRSLNAKQLKTLGIQLKTRYDHTNNVSKFIEYRSENTITFSVPIEDAGIVLDEAVKAGVSRVDAISFNATDEAVEAAKQEALKKATVDARNKAETVLTTLDLTIKEIIAIEIDRVRLPENKPATRRRRRSSSTPPGDKPIWEMPIIGGEIAIDAAVTLQISY